jgi:hypothetical protein
MRDGNIHSAGVIEAATHVPVHQRSILYSAPSVHEDVTPAARGVHPPLQLRLGWM